MADSKNLTENAGIVFLSVFGVLGLLFLTPLFGVLTGALVGWIVSIMAPVWVPTGLSFIGIKIRPDQLVELGAALGFLSGFFRINLATKKT